MATLARWPELSGPSQGIHLVRLRFHSVRPLASEGQSALAAREGRAPGWCVRSLRSAARADSSRRGETVSGRHQPQAVATVAGRSTRARASLSQFDGRRSRRAPARAPCTHSRSAPLTPLRYRSPQCTSALQRDAVELAARLASINLQARALALEKASVEARLKGLHDALARSALAPLSPAELEVQDRARILARDFGYPASFDFQLRAVSAVCTGHNTCLVWPAGAGKGLCTQLVAGCFPGMVTLCLVPLLALGHELCRNLNLAFGEA